MSFKTVKMGDEVYGTVYGLGKVSQVFPSDSFYTFEVEYKVNGQRVHYTNEGVPNWGNIDQQTVFYKKDIDLLEYDFAPSTEVLKPKQILKMKLKKVLEMRCPSGMWKSVEECPGDIFEEYIMSEKFHLFRETQIKQKTKKGTK